MFSTPEFKVGALLIIVSTIIGAMSLKVSEGPGLFSSANEYWFEVEDAGGLVKNSAVKSAGIKIGIIDDIKLKDGKAHVYIALDGDVEVHESGIVELRSDGILGDRHVEIVAGDPRDPILKSGSQLKTSQVSSSMQDLMKQVGKITDSLGTLADNINKATGPDGDTSTALGRIFNNIERLTEDLASISGQNKQKINEIVDQVHSITAQLDQFINDDSPEGFKAGWEKATSSLHRIENTLKNVDEIASKINSGEGTIGRLVNDEETADKINEALTNINDFAGGAVAMETSIDYHSEFLTEGSLTKSFINVRIQPGLDRYYEIGVVDDPRGKVETIREVQSGSVTSDIETVTTFSDELKFNALFAKNFYNFTVKGGLIESQGGVGIDYHLLNRDLRFSVEAFDFSDVAIRAFVRYNVFKGLYLVGGGDQLANSELRSGFVGAGLFITNDDLKALATRVTF